MNLQEINFPVYRKYKNNKSYFKIIHPLLFEEIQIVGSKMFIRQIEAIQFPERNFINDLITNFNQMSIEIDEQEYELVKIKMSN